MKNKSKQNAKRTRLQGLKTAQRKKRCLTVKQFKSRLAQRAKSKETANKEKASRPLGMLMLQKEF